tara:strand:- start:994 stop:1581 length:588 start_codon:yes stop_codon:yes gene_type:complete
MKLILASSSPRRKVLLKRLDYPFEIIHPKVKESTLSTDINPKKYCATLAKMKATYISYNNPNALVIGADTIVVIKNQILNKPIDNKQAEHMLTILSNNTHQVYTSIYLKGIVKNIQHSFTEITHVTFHPLEKKEILSYIKNYCPYDKAGAYGIQDRSSIFVKEIKGCYDNVVGFPISRFHFELKKLGINLLDTIS